MIKVNKKNVHILLHPELGDSKWDKTINGFIIILIILNVIAVILETVPSIHDPYTEFFRIFDLVSVIIFSIEYLLRVWSCTHHPKYSHPVYGRLKYITSTDGIIDLLAILPFYFHVVMGLDLRVLRILRLLRFLRLFRLTAYMKSAKMVRSVFVTTASELKLSMVLIGFLLIISACLLYFAEHLAQPKVFSSIPATIWWALVTITTVGYGDMVPITMLGKILTGIIAFTGFVLLALPAGIITAGFLEEMRKIKTKKIHTCPHCGKPLDHADHSEG